MLKQVEAFVNSDEFWKVHGFGLALLWIVGSTLAVLLKKVSVYLHAFMFFIVDVTTLLLVGGAWYRVSGHIDQFGQWPLLKQGHVVGGTIFAFFLILQHLGGVTALLGTKSSPLHKKFAYVLTNWARVVAYFGFSFGRFKNNTELLNFVLGATVVLFVLTTINAYQNLAQKTEAPSQPKKRE